MKRIKIKVYNVSEDLPQHGEIVHVVGYLCTCVYYSDGKQRDGFWFVGRNGERAHNIKEWFRILLDKDTNQIIKKNVEHDNMICRCGHIHKNHGKSQSINYTAGKCSECDCKNFVIDNN